jgi:threonine dehydrogenase-like Zn-dependent dehydrogenase
MKSGTILGHEGVAIVEEIGDEIRNFSPGGVVIRSTVARGYCSCCRAVYYSQCDYANPHSKGGETPANISKNTSRDGSKLP